MKKILFLFMSVFVLAGCAHGRWERLMTLKSLGSEQKDIHAYIEEQDTKFEALLTAVRGDALKKYAGSEAIKALYGEPIYVKRVDRQGGVQKEWLYRYATQFFDSEKVYLYFDREDSLVDWIIKGGL